MIRELERFFITYTLTSVMGSSTLPPRNPEITPFRISYLQNYSPETATGMSKYRKISYAQLEDFIASDHTNLNKWTEAYDCVNFSIDLVKNAEKNHIRAWIVVVKLSNLPDAHALVAFPTTDDSIIWIEPQSHDMYVVSDIGQPLCLAEPRVLCARKYGVITEIIQNASCDGVTHNCGPSLPGR